MDRDLNEYNEWKNTLDPESRARVDDIDAAFAKVHEAEDRYYAHIESKNKEN
jgi:hypothetical protein